MRFVASAIIALVLMGTVAWCQRAMTHQVRFDLATDAHANEEPQAAGERRYRLELTAAFAAVEDPFSVRTVDETAVSRLIVRRGDEVLLAHLDDIRRGAQLAVGDLEFAADTVALFVEATPSPADAAAPCALRVRLVTDEGVVCDEATLWSGGGGAKIAGAVELSTSPRLRTLDRGLGPGVAE